ncbi:MAG: MBL fold metallo-hydrolase [Candidatus Eremiobacteraeota bacterium]|nr:MBL fold metallo-hydrolase [Candidatus Eremiobacteraeota bacterium]
MIVKLDLEDTFGDIVRKTARAKDIPLKQVASQAGVDVERVEQFARDAAAPTEEEARALGKALGLDPGRLADIAFARWRPKEEPLPDHIGHQVNKPHPSNGYFIILEQQRHAAFVDPGGSVPNIVQTLKRSPVSLDYILVTHKHPDHIDGVPDLRKAFPNARIAVHRLDSYALGDLARGALEVSDGDSLPFGDGQVKVVHTPGHTDGSICFIYQSNAFTGDTLFAGSVGGIFGDKYGYEDLLQSTKIKIFTLPDDTVVLPGHGPPSTIGQEREHNPFF